MPAARRRPARWSTGGRAAPAPVSGRRGSAESACIQATSDLAWFDRVRARIPVPSQLSDNGVLPAAPAGPRPAVRADAADPARNHPSGVMAALLLAPTLGHGQASRLVMRSRVEPMTVQEVGAAMQAAYVSTGH